MQQRFRLLAVFVVLCGSALGCRTAVMVQPPRVSFAPLPASEVEAAIYAGCNKRKWIPTKIRDGLIQATLHQRSHLAVVEITYDDDSFNVSYVRSENLRYKVSGDEQRIHSSYNKWVNNLVSDVEGALNEQRGVAKGRASAR